MLRREGTAIRQEVLQTECRVESPHQYHLLSGHKYIRKEDKHILSFFHPLFGLFRYALVD